MRKIIGLAAVARSGKDTVASILLENEQVAAYALADPLKAGCQHLFGLTDAQTWDDSLKEVHIPLWGRSPRQLFQEVGTEWMRNHNPEFWLMRADREINGQVQSSSPGQDPEAYTLEEPIRLACQAFFGFHEAQLRDPNLLSQVDPFWGVMPSEALTLIHKLTLASFPDWPRQRPLALGSPVTGARRVAHGASTIIIKDVRFENEADFIRSHNGEIWHIVRPDAEKVNTHSSEAGISVKATDRTIVNDGTLEDLTIKVHDIWNQFSN